MEDRNNLYYKNSNKFLDYTMEDTERYLKMSLIPVNGRYTVPFRRTDTKNSYFSRDINGYKIVGKCIQFVKPNSIFIMGLPTPDKTDFDSIIHSVKVMEDEYSKIENPKWILSERELKIVYRYYGKIPYELEYFDSDYYDDINEFLEKLDIKTKNQFGEVTFKELDFNYANQILGLAKMLENKKGKDFHAGKFYDIMVEDWTRFGYKFYGILIKDKLLECCGIWECGNVARADITLKNYNKDWYREVGISTKYIKNLDNIIKYGMYKSMQIRGIKYYSIDGVGYQPKTDGLKEHKTRIFNREMKRYICRRI